MAASTTAVDQECVEGYLYRRPGPRLLLFRRPPERDRIWVPVSGKVEPTDPDYPSALRRELAEETGFREFRALFPLGWEFAFPGPDGRRWRLHAFGVELDGEPAPRLSDEHESFEWVDAEEAVRRLHFDDNKQAVRLLLERLRPSPNV